MTIRPATAADTAAMAVIYNEGIADRIATFETRERTADDTARWLGTRYPVLVAEDDNALLGFAVATPYSPRECYAGIGEFSMYIARSARGRGVGVALMQAFIEAAAAAGLWKLTGKIFAENAASLRLCAKAGFREVGVHHRHAQLDGVWRDIVVVERLL